MLAFEYGVISKGSQTNLSHKRHEFLFEYGVISKGSQTWYTFTTRSKTFEYGVISKGSQKANNNTCVSARHYSRRAYARTLLIKKTGLYGDILSGEFSL